MSKNARISNFIGNSDVTIISTALTLVAVWNGGERRSRDVPKWPMPSLIKKDKSKGSRVNSRQFHGGVDPLDLLPSVVAKLHELTQIGGIGPPLPLFFELKKYLGWRR